MKKIISILLLVAIGLTAFAGCAKNDNSNKLIMATNATFPPYEYYESEKIVGIDAEIVGKIAEKLGMEFEIKDMEFDTILNAVQSGNANIGAAGMTVTEERKQSVNFTDTYANAVQVVIVREDTDIKSVDDLKGKKIGVQTSTTGDIYASDDFGEENIKRYNKGTEAVQALITKVVDAVIIDNEPAKEFVKVNEGIKILPTEYATEEYAFAIAKENTELLNKVNNALRELKADGTVDSIISKYIAAE